MKKLPVILAVLIAFMNMSFTANAQSVYKDTLRVGISYLSAQEGWFFSESEINIVDADYLSYITTIPANTKFRIYTENGAVASDYFAPVTGAIRLDSTTPVSFNNSAYRGSFEVKNYNDTLTVINIVNTEEYLASVLGKEMSASWPIEALKAQAVCARNYAVTTAGKHSAYGFDICATIDCQVYGGIASEAESTRRAVEETRGVVVKYDGKVVPLYYFSCDGGYTEDSENVWPNALGYLRGKQDIYESPDYATYYNWTTTLTKTEIEDILYKKNINVGELLDIRIDEVSDNKGVTKLTFVGTLGEKSVTKTSTRTTLGLKSQAYTIEKKLPETTPVREETETRLQNVLTGEGVFLVTNPMYVLTQNGLETIQYKTLEIAEQPTAYESYTFKGHGWGHLVGMSQWGAYSMAKMGYTYQDILNFYYTDIVIEYNSTKDSDISEGLPKKEEENDQTQWSDTGI